MNKFIIDYSKKTLTLNYNGETFNFDLRDGDVGDYWNSFEDSNGVERDINFYQEDKNETPCLSVYSLIEQINKNGEKHLTIDTSSEDSIEERELIGDSSVYFD